MGAGMVASLARAGFRVDQYDRSPEALAASVAQSDLIEAAPDLGSVAHGVTIVSVAGEAAERAVLLGPGGVGGPSVQRSGRPAGTPYGVGRIRYNRIRYIPYSICIP